ncbi:MAG: hypothetical protein ACYTBZ_13615 [Planctomycetota bacterium]|jgi:hypothetical protein
MDEPPQLCHRCGAELESGRGQFYVIRIEAFADPSPLNITSEDLQGDIQGEIDRLMKELGEQSEQEIMDQVYRKMYIYLCYPCYREWIENPAG